MSVCMKYENFGNTNKQFSEGVFVREREPQTAFTSSSKWNAFAYSKLWRNRIIQRRHLSRLDERMLADIGYTALQAREEFSKPFWK